MGQRFSRNVRSNTRVHPTIAPNERMRSFVRPAKEYTPDGRILIHTPAPLRGSPGSITIVFTDGSYIIGRVRPETKSAEGYCEYRDIANRLIYTGYMYENSYNGWGSIWDESGSWPEYTTYWSMSRPANRVLHSTPSIMEWDYSLENSCDKEGLPIKSFVSGSRKMFSDICRSFANHKIGSSESLFQEIIQLYVNIRENPKQTPPSPNIKPLCNHMFHENVPEFVGFGPLKSSGVVRNPLRVRTPPETSKRRVEYA